jgi:hypothetical protein
LAPSGPSFFGQQFDNQTRSLAQAHLIAQRRAPRHWKSNVTALLVSSSGATGESLQE